MGYRTMVAGTDGSITAAAAAEVAVRLAKRFRARLLMVCAYAPPRMTRRMADGVADGARKAAARGGVQAEVELQESTEPAELILDVAEREGADLIVVGNKGIGQATRFRLGSIPDRVVHFSP